MHTDTSTHSEQHISYHECLLCKQKVNSTFISNYGDKAVLMQQGLVAHGCGAPGSCWPQGSASRQGTDGAPTETTIGAAQIVVWQRER